MEVSSESESEKVADADDNLRAEMQLLFSQSLESRQSAVNNEEWDQMRLQQRSNAIMSRAAFLTTDGAKA